MLNLEGRGVLIAGARRLGIAVARKLAKEGMRVGLTYRCYADPLIELQAELEPVTGYVPLVQGDLAVEEDARRVVETVADELGGLFAVVNLASDFERTPLPMLDGAAWDRAMASARASYLLALTAARTMAQNNGPVRGHLILFSDWAVGRTPYRDYVPYLAAKAAISELTLGFAVELAPQGILCNAIAPGPTIRPPDQSPEQWDDYILSQTPLGRESAPEDIAAMTSSLLKSASITGEVLRIDSGSHLAGIGFFD